jgi:hypothetical protein
MSGWISGLSPELGIISDKEQGKIILKSIEILKFMILLIIILDVEMAKNYLYV